MAEKTFSKSKNKLAADWTQPLWRQGPFLCITSLLQANLSCVYFLVSDFDLSKGDIWRVNVIELKQHTMEMQDKFVAILEKLFRTLFLVSGFIMLTKLDT